MRRLSLVAAAALAGAVIAAPAGAFGGGANTIAALQQGKVLEVSATTAKDQHSCQENRSGVRAGGHRFAPVACEFPPKANLIPPNALSKAVAATLATLG
jgi:predicted dinucleotide-utilizing enzyme